MDKIIEMEIKDYSIYTLILGLIVLGIFHKCERNARVECEATLDAFWNKVDTTPDTVTVVKEIPIAVDTQAILSINVPGPIKIVDTFYLKERDTVFVNDVNHYSDSVADSNITINYSALVNGKLLGMDLDYHIHFDTEVEVVEKHITKTQPVPVKTHAIIGGIDAGGNADRFQISPTMGYRSKSNNIFYYRYNITHSSHNIGAMIDIWKLE